MRQVPAAFPGRVPVLSLAVALWAVAAGCDAGRALDPATVRRVAVVFDRDTLRPGRALQGRAIVIDGNGDVVDEPVTWRSLTPATLAVSPTGEVVAQAPGVGIVRASTRSAFTDHRLELVNPPVARLLVAPESLQLVVPGIAVAPVVRAVDADGETVVGAALRYETEAPRIATVAASGLVNPVAAGRTRLRIVADGVVSAVPVVVQAAGGPLAPRLDAVAPATITLGTPFAVRGIRFTGATAVAVDGRPAQVLSVTDTLVTAQLPATLDACDPSGMVSVQVTTPQGVGAREAYATLAPRRTLAVGDAALLLSAPEARCVELPGDGRYLVTVVNAARALGAGPAGVALDVRSGRAAPTAVLTAAPAAATAEASGAHFAILDASRRYRPGPPARTLPALQLPPVGGLAAVRVPDLDDPRLCVGYRPIAARTVYSGTRIAILEDTATSWAGGRTAAGTMDAVIAAIGAEADAVTWPLVERFGNPLVMDDRLDANGKVVIVLTPALNAMRGGAVLGAVVTCDFFPRATAPASNVGEMLYLQVPELDATADPAMAVEAWRAAIRGTIAHELKHIVGFAERVARGQVLEEPWLEEATARHAEEVFTRAVARIAPASDAGYAPLRCEALALRGDPGCAGTPVLMRRVFEGLFTALDDPAHRSPLGPVRPGDDSFYGSAWSLLRFAMDHAALDEAAFVRALAVNGQSGVANLEARAGRGWEELLLRWSLAASTDGGTLAVPKDPQLKLPSWRLGEIFAGFCTDLGPCGGASMPGTVFTRAHPLAPLAVTGDAAVDFAEIVPAGFAAMDVAPAALGATRLLQLRGRGGAAVPGTVRLAILRIE